MNKIFLLLLLFCFVGCSNLNKVVYDEIAEKNILIDECNRATFNIDEFEDWFYKEYSSYKPDAETLRKIEGQLFDFDILIVMGTWCHDSRREVPRVFKILDHLAYHEPKIRLVNVDTKKRSSVIDTKKLDIQRVPTIIVYKDKEEVGRIIETPVESLEKNLVKIISANLD
ncbi:MAG: thioredoxin family protein [Rhodothermaceae bacterium]